MAIKTVALIHDVTGVGRCGMTVALPTLAAMNLQSCPAPTALLSAHPRFAGYTYHAVEQPLFDTLQHWEALGRTFDGILIGWVACEAQVDPIAAFMAAQRGRGSRILLDPVMGDNARIYSMLDDTQPKRLARLAAYADIITPNYTEACLLLDRREWMDACDDQRMRAVARGLLDMGPGNVVITSVADADGTRRASRNLVVTDSEWEEIPFSPAPESYPGTGDLFAAVLAGYVVRGVPVRMAAIAATDFATRTTWETHAQHTPAAEGLALESALHVLASEC